MTSPQVLPFEEREPGAADRARHWIARIDAGDLSADERQQLKDWLARSPEHRRLLDEHALLWSAASQARFPSAAQASQATPPTARPRPASPWAWGGGALAATVLVAAVLAWSPWSPWGAANSSAHFQSSHETGVGQQQTLVLPDGSRTELNARSALAVAYEPDRRRLRLERGVGMFDVAKDRARPFEVQVGHTLVRAVGTRFLVQRHASGAVEVTVYEGVVELQRSDAPAAGQPLRLGAGQVALEQADQTRLSRAAPGELERKLAWQQGRIVFDDSTLAAALEEVNRYSAQPIELADPSLQALRISGAFASRDVSVFLRSLEQGFGLKVEARDGRWVVSRG